MRPWVILGMEGLCDDFGFSEPYAAVEEIRQLKAVGKSLTEKDVEEIAQRYHCRVEWLS